MSPYVCSGKTYFAKEELKALGLRWDGQNKAWSGELSPEKLEKLKEVALKYNFNISKDGIIVFGDE